MKEPRLYRAGIPPLGYQGLGACMGWRVRRERMPVLLSWRRRSDRRQPLRRRCPAPLQEHRRERREERLDHHQKKMMPNLVGLVALLTECLLLLLAVRSLTCWRIPCSAQAARLLTCRRSHTRRRSYYYYTPATRSTSSSSGRRGRTLNRRRERERKAANERGWRLEGVHFGAKSEKM